MYYLKQCGISEDTCRLVTFLTQAMMGMLTHPHAKPEKVVPKDCIHILSELQMVKESE